MSPLRFLHLPKIAGSSFTSLLRRQYFGKRQFTFSGDEAADLKRFQSLSVKQRKRVALFTGHASLTTGIREADEALTITF